MIAHKRTTRPKSKRMTGARSRELAEIAHQVITEAIQEAYDRGVSDFENSTRDHPPYGFSDLQQAWKAGWLAGSQKAEGLNGGSRASRNGKSA